MSDRNHPNPDLAAVERALLRPRDRTLSSVVLERLGFLRESLVPAAVLCALVDGPDGLEMILTERMAHLRHHAGQVSFPGGRIDAGDATPEAAALREAQEEIGLDPGSVNLLGRLRDYPTITGFHVTPVVAHVPARQPIAANPNEVASVFQVPLAWLLDPANATPFRKRVRGATVTLHRFDYGDYMIWGATATMIMDFLALFRAKK